MSAEIKPLDDLFVVDLSRILSGPVCTMLLADMGAQVVKIEPPPLGDDSRLTDLQGGRRPCIGQMMNRLAMRADGGDVRGFEPGLFDRFPRRACP